MARGFILDRSNLLRGHAVVQQVLPGDDPGRFIPFESQLRVQERVHIDDRPGIPESVRIAFLRDHGAAFNGGAADHHQVISVADGLQVRHKAGRQDVQVAVAVDRGQGVHAAQVHFLHRNTLFGKVAHLLCQDVDCDADIAGHKGNLQRSLFHVCQRETADRRQDNHQCQDQSDYLIFHLNHPPLLSSVVM